MPPRELPPPSRPAPPGLRPDDYDAIRDAVMETARGRWFLSEYAARLRTAETASLLDSMKRLETAVAANHDTIMSRLAEALKEEPAEELTAAPLPPMPEPMPEPPPEARLAPRHMKYYRADEAVFEPAPEATISAVPRFTEVAREAMEVEEMRSPKRRIVIIRHKPGEQIDVPLAGDDLAQAS